MSEARHGRHGRHSGSSNSYAAGMTWPSGQARTLRRANSACLESPRSASPYGGLKRLTGAEAPRSNGARTRFRKIQAICNGKMRRNTIEPVEVAGEKPLAQEQWETMEKTMRRTMETMKNTGGDYLRLWGRKTGDGAARASVSARPSLFAGFVAEPGRNSQLPVSPIATIGQRAQRRNHVPCGDLARVKSKARPKRWGRGRANVTLHLLPCAAGARNASGIQSIPTIQGVRRSWPIEASCPHLVDATADRLFAGEAVRAALLERRIDAAARAPTGAAR